MIICPTQLMIFGIIIWVGYKFSIVKNHRFCPSGGFLSPKMLFRNPVSNFLHLLPIFRNKCVQLIVNGLLLLAVSADSFSDDGGALFMLRFKNLHIGMQSEQNSFIRTQSAKTEERKTRFFTFNRIKSLVFWSARLRFLLLNAIDKIFLTCNNFYSEMGVFAHMKGDLKMNIHAVVEDRVCSLSVAGRIDTLTAPELEQAFADHSAECDKMIFDLSEVDYISSAGLRVIVAAHREMERKNGLILRGLSKNVESIIKLTGFNRIMHIEP